MQISIMYTEYTISQHSRPLPACLIPRAWTRNMFQVPTVSLLLELPVRITHPAWA